MDASTSRRRGQRRSSTLPPVRMVAARMGSTLFFAPLYGDFPLEAVPAPDQQSAHIIGPSR